MATHMFGWPFDSDKGHSLEYKLIKLLIAARYDRENKIRGKAAACRKFGRNRDITPHHCFNGLRILIDINLSQGKLECTAITQGLDQSCGRDPWHVPDRRNFHNPKRS